MKRLSREEIRSLIENSREPSVSLYLPTVKAGKETQQNAIRFKNLLRRAEDSIQRGGLLRSSEAAELLQPAHRLLDDALFWQHQQNGLAVFLSSSFFRYYRVPIPFEELTLVDYHFHLKPLLQLLSGEGRFFVLTLNRKQVRLFESTRFHIADVTPEEVPTSFLDVVGHEVEERHVQWHTATPAAPGRRSAQFHGHGGGEEDVKPELRKFLAAVDAGVSSVLAGGSAPLVLVGLESLLPLYREANTYPSLLDGEIRINPVDLSENELRERAYDLVKPLFTERQRGATARYAELKGTGRASCNLEEIVPAAEDGRVESLFAEEGAQCWGTYDHGTRRLALRERGEGGQELLDRAAARTLEHGGHVYVVPPDGMPGGDHPAAAVFRY
jgi:hypothetical protein